MSKEVDVGLSEVMRYESNKFLYLFYRIVTVWVFHMYEDSSMIGEENSSFVVVAS